MKRSYELFYDSVSVSRKAVLLVVVLVVLIYALAPLSTGEQKRYTLCEYGATEELIHKVTGQLTRVYAVGYDPISKSCTYYAYVMQGEHWTLTHGTEADFVYPLSKEDSP